MNIEQCDCCGVIVKTTLWKGKGLRKIRYDLFGDDLSAEICSECAKKLFKTARQYATKQMK